MWITETRHKRWFTLHASCIRNGCPDRVGERGDGAVVYVAYYFISDRAAVSIIIDVHSNSETM
jgi:hypothetical protein